jgi:hypothetical protein
MRRPQPVVLLLQNSPNARESMSKAVEAFLINVTVMLQSMNQGRQRHHLSIAAFDDSVCPYSFAVEPGGVALAELRWPVRSVSSGVNVSAALAWARSAITHTETWILNNPRIINASPQDALWPVCFYVGDGTNSGAGITKEALRLRELGFMGTAVKVVAVNTSESVATGCLGEIVGAEDLITWPEAVLADPRMAREWLPDTDQTVIVRSTRSHDSQDPD